MSVAWLRDLEDKVRETATRLQEARAENETLQARIAELEAAVEAGGGADPEAAAWREERAEVRQRVEDLVAHLETLLRDGDGVEGIILAPQQQRRHGPGGHRGSRCSARAGTACGRSGRGRTG